MTTVIVKSVVTVVLMERVNVCQMLLSITSAKSALGSALEFSSAVKHYDGGIDGISQDCKRRCDEVNIERDPKNHIG